MKKYTIPVRFDARAVCEVHANSIEEAAKIAENNVLPVKEISIIDGSWELDCFDLDVIQKFFGTKEDDGETINLNLTRSEACDVLISTTHIVCSIMDQLEDYSIQRSERESLVRTKEKWRSLHNKIGKQIEEFDMERRIKKYL